MALKVMRHVGASAAELSLSITPAIGDQGDAIALLRQCEGEEPQGAGELGKLACASYLSGVLDMPSFWYEALPANSPVCLPDQGISNEQAMLIFMKWAKDHPGDLHLPSRLMAFEAFATAFPCPR